MTQVFQVIGQFLWLLVTIAFQAFMVLSMLSGLYFGLEGLRMLGAWAGLH